jgi:hypothetical protein
VHEVLPEAKLPCGLDPNRICAPLVGNKMRFFDARGVSIVERRV